MTGLLSLLAQAAPASQPGGASPGGASQYVTLIGLMAAFGVFYWLMFRGQRKERHKVQDMLKNLKRNDRVQTIGGILGSVVEVRDTEVLLKVDEAGNVKMRFNRGAIKEVLTSAPPEPPAK